MVKREAGSIPEYKKMHLMFLIKFDFLSVIKINW